MKRPLYENNGFMGKNAKKIVKTLWFLLDILGETLFGKKPARLKYCTYRKMCYDTYTMCILRGGINMEIKDEIKELRESTGMNRKEFCEYFGIPYRTVTEWERGTRKMPDYVFRLLAYRIKMEKFAGKEEVNEE